MRRERTINMIINRIRSDLPVTYDELKRVERHLEKRKRANRRFNIAFSLIIIGIGLAFIMASLTLQV